MNRTQIATLLQLQYNMNAKVNPDFVNAGYEWLRAVVVEGGEALEHHGWKWWKKQVMDREQLAIELVDILHFYLSHVIVANRGDMESAVAAIHNQLGSTYAQDGISFDGAYRSFNGQDTLEKIELVVGLAVARRLSFPLLGRLFADVGMSWDDAYRAYVGKNVLNFFRQDHGYKDGSYVKVWNGREDNEHMVDLAATLDMSAEGAADTLYQLLKIRYDALTEDMPG